jgi:hypothetical protein
VILVLLGLPAFADSLIRAVASYFTPEPLGKVIPLAEYSWTGWFIWALISYYVVKLYHPPVPDETPLDETRMKIGWLAIGIFVICFSFMPFTIPI